jgi:molybdate/tungstate transport system substrate-binding protein
MRRFLSAAMAALVLLAGLGSAAWTADLSGDVIIFHAGSLTVPLAEMEKNFESMHPGVDILREGGGSTKMARMISEVGKTADIMASADYKVIDNNLIPKFADWNVRFATNQLVLCYTDQSKYADEVGSDNWHRILLRDGVSWGHSDPNLDPCGYRSVMALKLAEKYYEEPGLFDKLIANRPEANVRPKSVELVNLLKTGNMDYAWEYLSVAVQHELKYITLPEKINLSNYKHDDFYRQACIEVTGKKPGTMITKCGKSITYGVTMTKDAPNPEAAEAFLAYMLSQDGGLKVLKSMGQPPFEPPIVPSKDMHADLPATLKPLIEAK